MRARTILARVGVGVVVVAVLQAYGGEKPEPVPAEENPQYYLDLAQVNLRYGEYEKAVELFEKGIELQPDDDIHPGIAQKLARAYLALDKFTEASTIVEVPVKNMEGTRKAQYLLAVAKLYKEKELFRRAEQTLLRAKESAKDERMRMRIQGELMGIYAGTPLGNERVRELEKRFMDNPKDSEAIRMLMDLHLYRNNFEAARSMAGHYARLNPNSVEALQELGFVYAALGDLDKAVETAVKLLEVDPKNKARHYSRIINICNAQEKFDEAETWADKAAKEGVESGTLYQAIAQMYLRAERTEEALKCYKKATEVSPDDHRMKYNYARLLVKNDRRQEAKEILEPLTEVKDRTLSRSIRDLLFSIYKDEKKDKAGQENKKVKPKKDK